MTEKAGKELADKIEKYLNKIRTYDGRDNEYCFQYPADAESKLSEFVQNTAEIIKVSGAENTDERLVRAARKIQKFDEGRLGHKDSIAYAFYNACQAEKKTNPFGGMKL